jgi:hypothetical protein
MKRYYEVNLTMNWKGHQLGIRKHLSARRFLLYSDLTFLPITHHHLEGDVTHLDFDMLNSVAEQLESFILTN